MWRSFIRDFIYPGSSHDLLDVQKITGRYKNIRYLQTLRFPSEADPFLLAPLRSSERRKLRTRTAERFQLTSEIADNLVPDGLLSQRFIAYNGEPGVSVVRFVSDVGVDGDNDGSTRLCRSSTSLVTAIRSGSALERVRMS
jgi:hypothetical protein